MSSSPQTAQPNCTFPLNKILSLGPGYETTFCQFSVQKLLKSTFKLNFLLSWLQRIRFNCIGKNFASLTSNLFRFFLFSTCLPTPAHHHHHHRHHHRHHHPIWHSSSSWGRDAGRRVAKSTTLPGFAAKLGLGCNPLEKIWERGVFQHDIFQKKGDTVSKVQYSRVQCPGVEKVAASGWTGVREGKRGCWTISQQI